MKGSGRGGAPSGRRRGSFSEGGNPRGESLRVRVKTAKGRPLSSTRWLERQLNDPYVAAAKREGYRSRAAYKLLELDDKLGLLKPGATVVDLGAAPGGWTQVAVARVNAQGDRPGPRGRVIGIDLSEMQPIPGAVLLQHDFLTDAALGALRAALADGAPLRADVVLSDMAAPATGHTQTDHLRIVALCEAAAEFAREVLAPGGAFVAKVLRGGTERDLLERLKRDYASVRHVKPPASRAGSAEIYVVATGFRGAHD